MIHGCVTLDEVFLAASVRAASLVSETSGYLALAVGDATSRLPFAIDDRMVMLTTEGNVGITKRGEVLPPKQAAAGLRNVLTRLLAVSTGTAMPALAVAARPREESDRGVDAVVEEIEAALIPVNRAAARRALARLARETIRAKDAGKVKPRGARAKAPVVEEEAIAVRPAVEPSKPAPAPARVLVVPKAPVANTVHPVAEADSRSSDDRWTVPPPAATMPRVATPEAPPVVMIARVDRVAEVMSEATTPPPMDIESRTSRSLPIVILPTPPPVPVMRAETPLPVRVMRAETPLPVPVMRAEMLPPPAFEPTPTLLGMGAVEVEGPPPEPEQEIVGAQTISIEAQAPDEESDGEENIETVQAPAVEAIEPETRNVLAQPSEDPDLAFELDFLGPRPVIAEPITPPFALDVEPPPRSIPATRAVEHRPRIVAAPDTGSRADDLLARFGASCVDDARMAQAAACLRQMTGVDPTPPPSRAALDMSPDPETKLRAAAPVRTYDLETPTAPRVRHARTGMSFGLALAVLAVGVAGGGALVRFRPDLFGVAAPVRVETTKITPAAPPLATTEPQGAAAPGWTPGGGARAERGTAERSR